MKQQWFKTLTVLTTALGVVACGGGGGGTIGGGGNVGGGGGTEDCTVTGQNTFVLTAMQDVYLYDDQLPALDVANFTSPEALLADLIDEVDVTPDDADFVPDTFSFIDSAEADAAFFGEGQFVGFGFSSTQVAPNDIRITRVFTGSPAANAAIQRGQQLIAVDGRSVAEIQAAEGLGVAFGPAEEGVMRTLTFRTLNNTEFDAMLTKAVVTIDPVPQTRIFQNNGTNFGYLELATFISTAEPRLEEAFQQFNDANVTDLILDLRYNGGGLVRIADLLGDYLGGAVAESLVFSDTRFNDNNAASNVIELFERLNNSMSLSRLVVITTQGTASASELVINSLQPHVQVQLVGDRTFGKPVGQIGAVFCDKILRPTAFETLNSLGEGRYFAGIPVDCAAEDDLVQPVGDPQEASTAAAISLLATGNCPSATVTGPQRASVVAPFNPPRAQTRAQREAYAW
ncbi:MAG: S41 family peptidase [Pseudomonadota bacterium]